MSTEGMQQSSQSQGRRTKKSYDEVVTKEQHLVNELEAITANIQQRARLLQNQSKEQNRHLDAIEQELTTNQDLLEEERQRLQVTRSERNQNLCWMYLIIIGEVLLFLFLVRWGLS